VKVKSVEFLELASLAMGPKQTKNLLEELHDIELQDNGWVHWRIKGKDTWHASPPSMIRNIEFLPEKLVKRSTQNIKS
jgi:hypothetical protein